VTRSDLEIGVPQRGDPGGNRTINDPDHHAGWPSGESAKL
jgi:hypothetical protein